jgi:hypothetical protein
LKPIDRHPIKATVIFSAGEAQAFKTAGATLMAAAATAVFLINFLRLVSMLYFFELFYLNRKVNLLWCGMNRRSLKKTGTIFLTNPSVIHLYFSNGIIFGRTE